MPRVAERTLLTRHDIAVAERPVIRLEPSAGRVLVHLVVPGIDRTVEITASPGAAVCALEDAAHRSGVPLSRVHADARHVLGTAAAAAHAPAPPMDAPLLVTIGALGFPLLAAAYATGAGAVAAVPAWAAPVLAAPDARHGARDAFGDKTTRPVISALARSLTRTAPEPVDLSRLALGLAAHRVLQPDRLAAVLAAPGDPWPVARLPTVDELDRLAEATRIWGGERTFGYVEEAASDAAGRQRLVECAVHAVDLGPHAPTRLPGNLADLRDLYRLQVRSTPPRATAPPARARAGQPENQGGPAGTVGYRALMAPPSDRTRPVDPRVPLPVPGWLAPVDGTDVGTGLGFVLPRRGDDLVRWGRMLANCVGDYRSAVAQGISHLVGVTRAGHLQYLIEITPRRRIRQFAARANRAVPRDDHDRIIAHLRSLGVLV